MKSDEGGDWYWYLQNKPARLNASVVTNKKSGIMTQKLHLPSTHAHMRWLVATKKSFLIDWILRRALI